VESFAVNTLVDYLSAAMRANTRRSYESAVRHFEVAWGGVLPATPDSLARYLAHHAQTFSFNTLKQRRDRSTVKRITVITRLSP
jgi:hypothetical protein